MTGNTKALVYYRPGCPFAARLRVALVLSRTPHRFQPFRSDEEGAARVRDANGGNEVSPTVLVRNTYLVNPSVRAVRAALK